MRTTVETDMITVKVVQLSSRNKEKIILALMISIFLICSIFMILVYVHKGDGHYSRKLLQNNYILLEKHNQSVNNNNDKYRGNYIHQSLMDFCSFFYLKYIYSTATISCNKIY